MLRESHSPLRVALISSILPVDAAGGEEILHRHLSANDTLQVTTVDGSAGARAKAGLLHRVLDRLQKSRLAPLVEDYWALREGRWLAGVCRAIDGRSIDVVLTVAHGDAHCAAQRFAKKHQLPLVSIYHDWWPDIPQLHAAARRRLERQFRRLAEESSRVLCVSEGMREALGRNANSTVLYPIPDAQHQQSSTDQSRRTGPYRVGYMGNLFTYGLMLREAIEESWKHPGIKFEVRGSNPEWPPEFARLAKERGNWLDFAKRDVLHDWLEGLDVFLVAMEFAPSMRHRMETSFPSKLTEFSKYGKPIVVWGPPYSSAVRWAEATASALVVASPDPARLLAALRSLSVDTVEQERLRQAARRAHSEEFGAERLQSRFLEVFDSLFRTPH